MTNADEGKTPEPPSDGEGKSECMGRYKHSWSWVWDKGIWTNRSRCKNCGEEKDVHK